MQTADPSQPTAYLTRPGGKRIAIWNMITGTRIMKLHPINHKKVQADSKARKFFISPDGRALAYQGLDTNVWSTGKVADSSQTEESP